MPVFEVTAPDGRVFELEGEKAPTEQELDEIFATVGAEQGFVDALTDSARTVGQNAATEIGAGLSGLFQLAMSQDPERAEQAINEFRNEYGYTPEGKRTQQQLENLGSAIDLAMQGPRFVAGTAADIVNTAQGGQPGEVMVDVMEQGVSESAGGAALDATGSPLAATAAYIAPMVAEQSIGFKGARMVNTPKTKVPRVSEGIKRVFRGGEEGRKAVSDTIEAFEVATGQAPTLGQATGRQSLQAMESVVGKFIGGKPVRSQLDNIADGAAKRVQQIADEISDVKGVEKAGRVISKGITGDDGFVARFQGKSGTLWKQVDDLIPEESGVDLVNTKKVLDESINGGLFGKVLDDPKLVEIKGLLDEADVVDYNTLKALRSQIGRKLSSNDLISDIPRADLKRLYGALTEDIKTAAGSTSPEALKAFNRANTYTRAGHIRLDDFVERVAKKVDLEKVFDAVTKGGEGSQVINSFKRSLKPDEWDVVVSNVVRRMGKATPGRQDAFGEAFSLDKFLTDYNKLGSAKKALFTGGKNTGTYADDLEKIAKVAQRAKESAKELAGQSGTTQLATNTATAASIPLTLITGQFGATGALIGLVAVNRGAAHLMSSPKFVKWLAKASTQTDIDLGKRIAELGVVINSANDAEARAIEEYVDSVKEVIPE